MYQQFRLAGSQGDGCHPYVNETGAFIGRGVPLLDSTPDAIGLACFRPRPVAHLYTLLAKGYGAPIDGARLESHLRAVAGALNDGALARAAIALLHANLPPLPDEAAAERLAKAERELRDRIAKWREVRVAVVDTSGLAKYNPDQPRVPRGHREGGQFRGPGRSGQLTPVAFKPGGESHQPIVGPPPKPPARRPSPLSERATSAGVSATPPPYKSDVVTQQQWNDFNNSVANLPRITSNEQFAYSETFAAEGGTRTDSRSGASSGITPDTFKRAKESGEISGLENVTSPSGMTPEQRAAIYKWHVDHEALSAIGGGSRLLETDDKESAAAYLDVMFPHGPTGGAQLVKDSVNETIRRLSPQDRVRLGVDVLPKTGTTREQTFEAYKALSNGGYGAALRDALGNAREASGESDHARIEHFRFRH